MNVLELEGVGVQYKTERIRSIKQLLVGGGRRRSSFSTSLRDVSLSIRAGESVGVVGANGAGKSTLLRVASGIIHPSTGVVVSRGTVVPVMELGTGFEPEMSGRENIFFNGALLGRTRGEMRAELDSIVAFSGVEPFIDAPMRTYSTGMVARLAFAIATAVDAETLLLDELLAVGDAMFRRQCEERIESFVERGRTVVLVSHETDGIVRLCRRAIWLHAGQVVADGPSAEVIARYENQRPVAVPPRQA